MKTPMINHQIKLISLLLIVLSAVAIAISAVARADGALTSQEQYFGDQISKPLCEYIDTAGVNNVSMNVAISIIYRHTPTNMDASDAVDIINYVVFTYCPDHWGELVAFGDRYRNAHV